MRILIIINKTSEAPAFNPASPKNCGKNDCMTDFKDETCKYGCDCGSKG
ncbi:hypothetical protein [Methanosarcina sp.]|nr:hypothetical protein [Methanosarcina sp.]MDY9925928.1 hypothetical protein [Methanosarcina sp.]